MLRVLLGSVVLGSLGLAVAALSGVLVFSGHLSVRAHIVVGVAVLVLVLFSLTLTAVYFASVESWVRQSANDADSMAQARSFKQHTFPWLLAAGLATSATFLVGGAVDTGHLPAFVHALAAVAALAVQAITAYRSIIFVGMAIDLVRSLETQDQPAG